MIIAHFLLNLEVWNFLGLPQAHQGSVLWLKADSSYTLDVAPNSKASLAPSTAIKALTRAH